jgi:ribosomal protein L32
MDFERVVVRLEWECESCGEAVESPHESCPNCGGTDFSRLRDLDAEPDPLDDEVRVSPSTEPQQLDDNIVWECANCGKRHMRNSPPCNSCGNAHLEKVSIDLDEEREIGVREDDQRSSVELFGYTSSALSLAGLVLAVVGGLVIMYGGFIGMRTALYVATGQLPQSAWSIIRIGAVVGVFGAAIVLFDTRHHDISF